MNFLSRKTLIVAALIAIPLFSVNMQLRSKSTPWVLMPFYFASSAIQNGYAKFSFGVRSTTDLYLNLINVKKENRILRQKLAEYEAQQGANTELKLENERLNKLLDFRRKTNMHLLAAHIIGRDIFTDYHTITIDRGRLDGVKRGMGVIAINGVVGYAIEIEPHTSKILLITDRNAVVDAIVQRSRAHGILQGLNRDTCEITFIKRSDDVKVGDTIITSGLDNYFPKGFPIGTVTSVSRDQYGLGQNVLVRPVVDAADLEEVFVILNANYQNLENLTAEGN